MTVEEYYRLLEIAYKQVDWNNLNSIMRYNEYKRELRKELEE